MAGYIFGAILVAIIVIVAYFSYVRSRSERLQAETLILATKFVIKDTLTVEDPQKAKYLLFTGLELFFYSIFDTDQRSCLKRYKKIGHKDSAEQIITPKVLKTLAQGNALNKKGLSKPKLVAIPLFIAKELNNSKLNASFIRKGKELAQVAGLSDHDYDMIVEQVKAATPIVEQAKEAKVETNFDKEESK